jgi:Arc/MetJ-type ribon-helix-helix transcriptional regulator
MQPADDRDKDNSGDVIIEQRDPDDDEILVTKMENDEPKNASGFDDLAASVKGVAQKTGEAINKATESIGKAIESALSARDHVVMVRVNDESLRGLDALIQSGIFKSRSEAAAFLISEGIKAQSPLFDRIKERISEIERLRAELKDMIKPQED